MPVTETALLAERPASVGASLVQQVASATTSTTGRSRRGWGTLPRHSPEKASRSGFVPGTSSSSKMAESSGGRSGSTALGLPLN
jgi:hypothetical protein